MSSVINYYRYLFRKHFISTKTLAVGIVLILILDIFLMDVRVFSKFVGVDASIWGVPLVLCTPYLVMLLILLYLFWISDFPILDRSQMYIVARIGKKKLLCGQVLYVISTGFFYSFFIWFGVNFLLISVMNLGGDWGPLWGTLSQGSTVMEYGILLKIPYRIISNSEAIKSNVIMFFITSLTMSTIGVSVLATNTYIRSLGIVVGTLISFFGLATRYLPNKWIKISLADWIQIDNYNSSYDFEKLSNFYVCSAIVMINLIIILLTWNRVKKISLGK